MTYYIYSSKFDKPSNEVPAPTLNGGISTDRQMGTFFQCLKTYNTTFIGDGKSIIYFSDSITFEEVEKDLEIDIDEEANIGIFSEDASASYTRHIKDDKYSRSFYYSEKVELPGKKLNIVDFGTNALSDVGKQIYELGADEFREKCGDQVIFQQSYGAGLYVTLKINFHTHSDKETFSANIDVTLGDIGSASASISSVVSKYNLQASIEVSAFQIGGDPSQIAKIFTEPCGPHYCITSCSFTDLSACQGIIDGIIKYAATDFPNQINFQGGQILGDAAVRGSVPMNFTELELNVGPSILNSTIIDARKELGAMYNNFTEYQTTLDHILTKLPISSFLDSGVKKDLEQEQANVGTNINLLQDPTNGAINCYFAPKNCPSILASLQQNLKPLNTAIVDQFKQGYNCHMYDTIAHKFNNPTVCLPIGNNNFIVNYAGQQFIYSNVQANKDNLSFDVNGKTCVIEKTGDDSYSLPNLCETDCPTLPLTGLAQAKIVCHRTAPIFCKVFICDDFNLDITGPIDLDWI